VLPISLDELASEHILSLLQNEMPEQKTLDYKQGLPGGGEGARKEFLADVSSFANASGGDLVFGIAERRSGDDKATGLPGEIHDLALGNPSADCARLENIIRDGVQPRIPGIQIKAVAVEGHGCVLVVRIPRSWIGPHMVAFGNASRFFSRNNAGKYQLDVQQIGEAFTTQRTLGERLRNWRADRIGKTLAGEGPCPSPKFHPLRE
jgi:predicted HTH transcriptional regulator